MREMSCPGHGTDSVLRTFSVSDLLTCVIEQRTQLRIKDADTPSKRLEGLIPVIADFHAYGNFMEVKYLILIVNNCKKILFLKKPCTYLLSKENKKYSLHTEPANINCNKKIFTY